MSQIQVDNIYNKEATGSPSFPLGANVTGVITATTFKGGAEITSGTISATSATFSGAVSVGGTLTYEDVTNIDSVGVITARQGIKITAGGANIVGVVTATNDIKANGNIVGDNSTNISGVSSVTATTYYGSGASLTGIDAAPQVKVNASGTISAGDPVIANTDGTVSSIAETIVAKDAPVVSGITQWGTGNRDKVSSCFDPVSKTVVIAAKKNGSPDDCLVLAATVADNGDLTYGSEVSIGGNPADHCNIVWDSTNSRFVVFIRDNSDSNKGKCRVGSLSGNTITVGSLITVTNTAIDQYEGSSSMVFDPDTGKVIFTYTGNFNNNIYSKVGTVSGLSITFGAEETIDSTGGGVSVTYDTQNDKLVCASRRTGSNGLRVYVGTVNGGANTITWGTPVDVVTTEVSMRSGDICYMTEQQKVFLIFVNTAVNNRLRAIIGTVSGNSISFGTAVDAGTGTVANLDSTAGSSVDYDTYSKLPVLAWEATSSSQYGFMSYVKSISGTVPTMGPATYFGDQMEWPRVQTVNLISGSKIFYAPINATSQGKLVTVTTAEIITNITSENYIGVSDGNYTNGQQATIKLSGNTDNNQSGLISGQNYFSNNAGILTTTAADPQVYVGNAVSSTKLVLASPVSATVSPGWEVVESIQLDGTRGYIDSNGWSNEYARYQIVYDNIYCSSNWKPYMRIYKDATSGNAGTLKTANEYGSGSGYQRVQVQMNQLQRTGRYPSDFWKTGWNSAATYWSGENTFPMLTSLENNSIRSHWYGFSFRGYEHTYTSASGYYNVDENQYLTGIRFYFSTNDSGNTINPTSGRFTILRLKV